MTGKMMQEITCSGSPYEIGYQHGKAAKSQVQGSIDFYSKLFQENVKIAWPKVQEIALGFEDVLKEKWPRYLEEMRGLAEGAGKQLADIIALNVRTEINFGLFSDGCTALSLYQSSPSSSSHSFLAQNWDWEADQKQNLVLLTLIQPAKPTIKMVTEAGIIGKIGLNSSGVGVCLNAIRAKGMDKTRMPCHLGLRTVLESNTKEEAIATLTKYGIASACHMLIADARTGGTGLEFSFKDVKRIDMNDKGQVFHTNHYLVEHENGVIDTVWLKDSLFRIKRIEQLCDGLVGDDGKEKVVWQGVQSLFKDEQNYPGAICRGEKGKHGSETLFNIVMDLKGKAAKVILGRPTEAEGFYELSF